MRTDLLVIWFYPGGMQLAVIELKRLHESLDRTLAQGLQQTWEYLDQCSAEEGHLVIFDRSACPWAEKIYRREETHRGRRITVWGC